MTTPPDTSLESPQRGGDECRRILELMERSIELEEASGVVDELASRRVEQHLLECDNCMAQVSGEEWTAVLPPIPMPTTAQWQQLDDAVLTRPHRLAPVSLPFAVTSSIESARQRFPASAVATARSSPGTNPWGSGAERVPWQSRALAAAALLLCCLLGLQAFRTPEDSAEEQVTEFAFEFESAVEVIDHPEDVNVIIETFPEESDGAIVIFVSG